MKRARTTFTWVVTQRDVSFCGDEISDDFIFHLHTEIFHSSGDPYSNLN